MPADLDPAADALREKIRSFRQIQLILAMAEFGIADALKDHGRNAAELAGGCGVPEERLKRLLRGFVVAGLLDEGADGRYVLTPMGACLRSDAPGSVYDLAMESRVTGRAWQELCDAIRTGEIAFDRAHGTGYWTYCAAHPEFGERFHRRMARGTESATDAIVRAYDFNRFDTIVDVGGGYGTLLIAILRANARAKGIVFDSPSVESGAAAAVEAAGLSGRCRVVGGSFFEEIPAGGDAYVLKSILHDWDDAHCGRILAACRRAMRPGDRLLVIEGEMPETVDRKTGMVNGDLEMLVLVNGKERTREEYSSLFEEAGFDLDRVVVVQGDRRVFEGVAR